MRKSVFHDEVETHDINKGEDIIFVLYRMCQGGQETVEYKQAL